MVELATFVQEPFADTPEWAEVLSLAERLHALLNTEPTHSKLRMANQPGASSAEVQGAFRAPAESLGFQSERRGLFADSIAGLRPDYFRPMGSSGVILEVERGKTTTNNMDLLDFWKCHISASAAYLFLLVPLALQHNPQMTPKKEFASVRRRLGQFFLPGNYTNVRGLCLFGY